MVGGGREPSTQRGPGAAALGEGDLDAWDDIQTPSQIVWQLTGPPAGRAGWCIKHVCAQLLLIASVNSLKRRALGSPPYPGHTPVTGAVSGGQGTEGIIMRGVYGANDCYHLRGGLMPPSPLCPVQDELKRASRQRGLLACVAQGDRLSGSLFFSFLFFSFLCSPGRPKYPERTSGQQGMAPGCSAVHTFVVRVLPTSGGAWRTTRNSSPAQASAPGSRQ